MGVMENFLRTKYIYTHTQTHECIYTNAPIHTYRYTCACTQTPRHTERNIHTETDADTTHIQI